MMVWVTKEDSLTKKRNKIMGHYKGKKVGFTAGNFDLIHPGYIYTFETAKKHCDYFLVFLHSDPSAGRNTKYKPVIPLHERYKTLMALEAIDEVDLSDQADSLESMAKSFTTIAKASKDLEIEALKETNAKQVDVSSGIEDENGRKDVKKIVGFVEKVKEYKGFCSA